jgi:hypothetical protein
MMAVVDTVVGRTESNFFLVRYLLSLQGNAELNDERFDQVPNSIPWTIGMVLRAVTQGVKN